MKEAISEILLDTEAYLKKRIKEHREASKRLMEKVEDLEKPWRVKVKEVIDTLGAETRIPTTYRDWRSATVQWLSTPQYFTPSRLPVMKVSKTSSAGIYDSAEDYIDTMHRLWVAMTFADGYATLAPQCRCRTTTGVSCQNTLYPIADVVGVSSKLRCRTRSCNGHVEFACRMKSHEAVCGPCASRAVANHLGGPGPKGSTHIYDGRIDHMDSDGRISIKGFVSRNPPQHTIHWRSTKRLSSPNLVGIVLLKSKGSGLSQSDRIIWGEICFQGKPQDEPTMRQHGELNVNLASIADFDYDGFPEGSHVAFIDCMTFVPEWIPVLHALEKQKEAVLPFENGKYLNLWRDQPADITNSVLHNSSPEEVFHSDTSQLICDMINERKLEPIREIRRDLRLRDMLQSSMNKLVAEATLDKMQLISFIDAFRNPVHLTQGPPGTGKSYLGVVIVRALIVIRDLWVKKSRSIGTPPILVLSYKDHAIDEFLVDLVKAEPGQLMNKLIRIGGQCKDQRLVRYSEYNAFQSDKQVNECRSNLNSLTHLRESMQVILDTCVSSFLSFRLNIFGEHDGSPRDVTSIRAKAANEATSFLMASLVRKELLNEVLSKLEEGQEDEASEKGKVKVRTKDVSLAFSFLNLDSDQKVCNALERRINQDKGNRGLVSQLDEGVAHYNLDHWGDILHKFLCGTAPLPFCAFEDNGKKCQKLSVSPDEEFCHDHLCRFKDCSRACASQGIPFCSDHGCCFEECTNVRVSSDQLFCKTHSCKKCIELGLKSGPATDDPPRNVCEEHPLCFAPSCEKFTVGDEMYCTDHTAVKCKALNKKKQPCKSEAIYPDLGYCHAHKHLATEAKQKERLDEDTESQSLIDKNEALPARERKCLATTKKGKPCKGSPTSDLDYCFEHSFLDSKFVKNSSNKKAEGVMVKAALMASSHDELAEDGKPNALLPVGAKTVPSPGKSEDQNKNEVANDEEKDQDLRSVVSSDSAGNIIIDPTNYRALDLDEISIEETGGDTLQHLLDVFEVRNDDASENQFEDEFVDAESAKHEQDGQSGEDEDFVEACYTDSKSWNWKMTLDERWDEIQNLMYEQRILLEQASLIVKSSVAAARKELQKARI